MIVIINGNKNPHRNEVARDIIDAVLKSRAVKGAPAQYRTKEEQLSKLTEVFDNWSVKGTVWSAAASKVGFCLPSR
jgi:hypothetical protein